jgi:hypothetical protein
MWKSEGYDRDKTQMEWQIMIHRIFINERDGGHIHSVGGSDKNRRWMEIQAQTYRISSYQTYASLETYATLKTVLMLK